MQGLTAEEMQLSLEEMIDKTHIRYVLELLEEICNEKAMHIEANWQDDATNWYKAAELIGRTAQQPEIKAISPD